MFARKDDKIFVRCQAGFTDNITVTKEEGIVEPEEELKGKGEKLLAQDKVNEFSEKHSSWVYEISENNAANLSRRLAGLLDDEGEVVSDLPSP